MRKTKIICTMGPVLESDQMIRTLMLEGMDVVDKIAAAETDDNDKPKKDIKIEKIEIIKDYDFSK